MNAMIPEDDEDLTDLEAFVLGLLDQEALTMTTEEVAEGEEGSQ